jgi:hypothetical protein
MDKKHIALINTVNRVHTQVIPSQQRTRPLSLMYLTYLKDNWYFSPSEYVHCTQREADILDANDPHHPITKTENYNFACERL